MKLHPHSILHWQKKKKKKSTQKNPSNTAHRFQTICIYRLKMIWRSTFNLFQLYWPNVSIQYSVHNYTSYIFKLFLELLTSMTNLVLASIRDIMFTLAMSSSCYPPLKTANNPTIFTMNCGLRFPFIFTWVGKFVDCCNGTFTSPMAKNATKHCLTINQESLNQPLLTKHSPSPHFHPQIQVVSFYIFHSNYAGKHFS